jgi:ABC-type phosphate transport system substrate-binding protein
MQILKRLMAVAVLLVITVGSPQAQTIPVQVIVNPANPLPAIDRVEAARIFLKKLTKWPNGQPTQPVDLPENSSAREQFSTHVLGKSVSAVSAYWQQQIFAGKELPPLTKASEAEVIAYVKANANAVGYVSASTSTREVKVLLLK